MKLYQPIDNYRYNSDSLLLYHFASVYDLKGRLLDIGTGCGIIGLLLAREFSLELVGIDLQQEFIMLAEKNAELNHISARFICKNFKEFDEKRKFDCLVSNPPFYKEMTKKSQNKNLQKARYTNFLPLDILFAKTFSLLSTKGVFLLVYKADFLHQIIQEVRLKKLFCCKITFVHSDLKQKARLVLLEIRKYQRTDLEITAPIIMDNDFKKAIATKANLESIDYE